MPAVLVLGERHALALERPGQDHRRLALDRPRFLVGGEQLVDVVPVDRDGVPAEGAPAGRELLEVVPELRRPALSEAVDVGDRADRVELEELAHLGGFPHRAFRRFTVAHHHVGAGRRSDAAGVERDADGGGEALAERAGRQVDEVEARRRVPFQVGRVLAQLHDLAAREEAGFGPGGVEDRGGVALRQHEAVVLVALRVLRIEAHLAEEKRRHDLRGGTARGGVAAASLARRLHRVDAELGGDVLERSGVHLNVYGHNLPPGNGECTTASGLVRMANETFGSGLYRHHSATMPHAQPDCGVRRSCGGSRRSRPPAATRRPRLPRPRSARPAARC